MWRVVWSCGAVLVVASSCGGESDRRAGAGAGGGAPANAAGHAGSPATAVAGRGGHGGGAGDDRGVVLGGGESGRAAADGGQGGNAQAGEDAGGAAARAGGGAGGGASGTSTANGKAGEGNEAGATGASLRPLGSNCADTAYTSCSTQATCDALGCGQPWSEFDANGCLRQGCASSDECGASERCVASNLHAAPECLASISHGCRPTADGTCECTGEDSCGPRGFCQPAADFPLASECDVTGMSCRDLSALLSEVQERGHFTGDTAQSLTTCENRVVSALATCDGVAGAAGGG